MHRHTSEGVNRVSRREFLALATAVAASPTWATNTPSRSSAVWRESSEAFPEGVASGDPDAHSVILWTRRPSKQTASIRMQVEVSEDAAFHNVIARARVSVSPTSDWTARVLVGNLRPASVYWYRFTDAAGFGSRIGRTVTAPTHEDPHPVRFAVVSCQNVNLGTQNAYRRMIFEDERAPAAEQLGFVLHLGDFIYDTVYYPEENPDGVLGRVPIETVRYPHGEKVGDYHIPVTLEDYRAIYRAYLHDPDIQDARARWPFVPIWDNHEFSGAGWQSLQVLKGQTRPAQTRKVAANQAWFEFQPARIKKSSGPSLSVFGAPQVTDTPVTQFDDHGLGQEPNNLAALGSLTGYRALRWGKHVELIITDQRSYRSARASNRAEAKPLWNENFPNCIPQEALEILDGGHAYDNGKPPEKIRFGADEIDNFRRNEPAQTILGAEQKQWFMKRLQKSSATWKIWGNTTGTLDRRVDPQNLPTGLTAPWPGTGYAAYEDGDHGSTYTERAEIYSLVRRENITGFVTVAGDRHSFWAGLAAPTLPPQEYEPVGIAFIAASISAPSSADILASYLPPDHPLYSLYFAQPHAGQRQPVINMLLRHGVRSSLEYARTGNAELARRLSNPDLAPHLKFVDFGAHGFATVRAASDCIECEFVCIPRPLTRASTADGAPVLYRVIHRAPAWNTVAAVRLEQRIVAGNPILSL